MAYIAGVHSAFPEAHISREDLLRLFQHETFDYSPEKLVKIEKIIESMQIEGRPTTVDFSQFWDDLDKDKCPCTVQRPSPENLFRGATEPFRPTITDRSTIWESAVKELSLRTAKGVLARTNTALEAVECVITNTSSGVMLPNLSTWLPQQLQLSNIKCNYSIDNTGCGGAITCLDVARSVILSKRASCVLIVTVDCASPHLNTDPSLDMEGVLPNMLFGDGAGAVIVTNKPDPDSWGMGEPRCVLLGRGTSNHIALSVKDHGYYLSLSKDLVPSLYGALKPRWPDLLKDYVGGSQNPDEVEWLVHPGGKAILDCFARLEPPLTPHSLRHSHKVMRENGNLVSATLIFVLELMMKDHLRDKACLVGPGPGVEVKFLVLDKVL